MSSPSQPSGSSSLHCWFPLTCRALLDLLLAFSNLPFFRFFAALLIKSRLRQLCSRRAGPRPGDALEPKLPLEQVFPPTGGQEYGSYRIPALLQLGGEHQDVLLAFAEGRGDEKLDWGHIDLVVRRSTDGGSTWSKLQVVASGDLVGLPGATVGNPCACWDAQRRRVVLLLSVTEAGAAEPAVWCRAAPPRRVFVTFSADGGLSWEKPRDISSSVTMPGWTWYATGPGRAVQLQGPEHAGRIVVPCDHVLTGGCAGPVGLCCQSFELRSHAIFSDDGGETWQLGGCGPVGTNECQLAELADGSLYLNMRDFTGRCRRRVAVSRDGGASFEDRGHDEALLEPLPAGCQASVLALPQGPLLYSGPADPAGQRRDLQLRCSSDGGKTWQLSVRLHAGLAAYSCIELLRSGSEAKEVVVLFESGSESGGAYESISLCRVPIAQLLGWIRAEAQGGEGAPLIGAAAA